MNLTISVDERLLRRVRALARSRGTSLQELIRNYLESMVGDLSPAEIGEELVGLLRNANGRSGGRRVVRADAYKGRV